MFLWEVSPTSPYALLPLMSVLYFLKQIKQKENIKILALVINKSDGYIIKNGLINFKKHILCSII
jgi:hypothetical protein